MNEIDILSGRVCPYCKERSELIDSKFIYGKSYGMVWKCPDPACDAYVGVHKGTEIALGRLANRELREYKKMAHAEFDKIWRLGIMKRREAYEWLSNQMQLSKDLCHIGMFDVAQCQKVIEICKTFIDEKGD